MSHTLWLPKPQKLVCLDLHGYNGCRYRLIRPRREAAYSVEITRPGSKANAILNAFTQDLGDAQAFTRFLMESGARPEQLPHAAAAYYCVRNKDGAGLT
jgi:hypothetical protein